MHLFEIHLAAFDIQQHIGGCLEDEETRQILLGGDK